VCDYSLMNVPNRLANVGEELVTHRFPAGALGLASPSDLPQPMSERVPKPGSWTWLKLLFTPERSPAVPAICVPPGSRLLLHDIPHHRRERWHVGGTEEVTFTQLTAAAATFRDAIRFDNGRQALFQELSEGQRVKVLDMSLHEPIEHQEFYDELLDMVHERARNRVGWRGLSPLSNPPLR
jgi:hypothetical protein